MQYLNFVSKKIFFSAVSIYGLLFLRVFWWSLINCLNSKRSNFVLLRIFSLQLSLHSSLRMKILLFTLKTSFLLLFQNLLFQNMLINLAEKESSQHVFLNILHKCDRSSDDSDMEIFDKESIDVLISRNCLIFLYNFFFLYKTVNKSSARYYEKTKKDNKTAIYGRVRYINLPEHEKVGWLKEKSL